MTLSRWCMGQRNLPLAVQQSLSAQARKDEEAAELLAKSARKKQKREEKRAKKKKKRSKLARFAEAGDSGRVGKCRGRGHKGKEIEEVHCVQGCGSRAVWHRWRRRQLARQGCPRH